MNFVYNDEFDKTEYPIEETHEKTIESIAEKLGIPKDQTWFYQATIHGRIFQTKTKFTRLYLEFVQFFANLNGLRWIEFKDETFFVGIEHKIPQ